MRLCVCVYIIHFAMRWSDRISGCAISSWLYQTPTMAAAPQPIDELASRIYTEALGGSQNTAIGNTRQPEGTIFHLNSAHRRGSSRWDDLDDNGAEFGVFVFFFPCVHITSSGFVWSQNENAPRNKPRTSWTKNVFYFVTCREVLRVSRWLYGEANLCTGNVCAVIYGLYEYLCIYRHIDMLYIFGGENRNGARNMLFQIGGYTSAPGEQ